jgi:protein TonB
MMPSRYFYAFFISTLSFLLFYVAILSLSKIEKNLKPKLQKVIKIAIVTPPKEIVPPKIVAPPPPVVVPEPPKEMVTPPLPVVIPPKPMVKEVVKPKPKPKKKIVKPKPKPKPKKIIKKKVIKKKPIVKKPVVKKPIVKKAVPKKKVIEQRVVRKQPVVQPPIAQPVPTPAPVYVAPPPRPQPVVQQPIVHATPKPIAQPNNTHHKKAFLQNVRSQIMANKKYPKIAKRRHIEGSVKVRFDITRAGQVSNIRFVNGKSIFHKSIKQTLQDTFPMAIPQNVKSDLPILNVSVVLHFNIR